MLLPALHSQFCQYKADIQCLSPRTVKWHRDTFRMFLKFKVLDSLSEVTRHHIEDWISWGKNSRGWSPKTIRNSLMALSVFLDWCIKEQIIDYNPTKDIPKPNLPKKTPRHLNLEQVKSLFRCAYNYPYFHAYERNRALAVLAVFVYAGLRYKELMQLKFEDVDLQNKCIYVFDGKGAKDRVIPFTDQMDLMLRPYIRERSEVNPFSPFFFVSRDLPGRMSDNVIKRLFAKLKQESGIHFSAHMLRHTFATLLLEGNTDIYTISSFLGHSSIETTTIYLTASMRHKRSEITKHPLKHINLTKGIGKPLGGNGQIDLSGGHRRVA